MTISHRGFLSKQWGTTVLHSLDNYGTVFVNFRLFVTQTARKKKVVAKDARTFVW